MHAWIAIAANALDTSGLSNPVANLVHRAAAEGVAVHGRLVFGSNQEASELVAAIRQGAALPQDARNRWIEVLTHLRKTNRITVRKPDAPALASIRALDDLRLHWWAATDVAVVAAEVGEVLGAAADAGHRPEVATAATLDDCRVIRRIRSLAEDATAAYGSDRERFWSDVLEPLATGARQVTIVDRYLFKSLWDLDAGKYWTRRWRGEHLSWLLQRIDSVADSGAEVRLVGAWNPGEYPAMTATSTADALKAVWAPTGAGRLAKVTVTLASPARVVDFPHDRHIRFSTGAALMLGAGFDRLRESAIRDQDGLNWQYRWSPRAIREVEAREQRALALPHTEAVVYR
ncbi:hypothetical protein B0E53_03061 [Micromonospora sp. MH33]|uniref:hypothetical protein n=1 Tax=Micromonospora sp. MH33 TaxID=1945509 RepID=UPI000D14ACB0|nr:hypothetical protein [Micromonospora sp. MH33]PSK64985.1 hypothetical protein B0E53_03061 [Micromonospora sp. MH33]